MNHEHAGFSWYVSSKPGIYNPYNLSDRISRKTWLDNIVFPKPPTVSPVQKRTQSKCGPHNLFNILSCPYCTKN